MKLVQRGNKQLRVPEDELDCYLGQGYREVKAEEGAPEKPKRKPKELRRPCHGRL